MNPFNKGYIADIEIKNRFVMAPMISNLCNIDGTTNENHIQYLEDRAKGGFGLIITEYSYVDEINGKGSPNQMGIFSMSQVPKLSRLTERIHDHGTRIFAQLVHAGGKANPLYNSFNIMAPSSKNYMGNYPAEMSIDDIHRIEDKFVKAAEIASLAGFDGIELHGAHGYLLHEFLSPALNTRNDAYGGSLENRVKIINEIVSRIKKSTDIAVGIRLSLYEDEPDGYQAEYTTEVINNLKGIDYFHLSAGRNSPPGSSASFYWEHNHILAKLKDKIDKKIMMVGSIINPEDMQKAIDKVDFIALGRQALADPHTPFNISNNKPLRPCIRCNQACRNLSTSEVRCTVNPDTGIEATLHQRHKFNDEISIVGAGIKGLEAAVYAISLGFKPAIYEKATIGGQFNEINDPYKMKDFGALLNYYSSVLYENKVEIINENCQNGIMCLPDVVYPDITAKGDIAINTNIYRYFDDALKLAENNSVAISTRSLKSLERSRSLYYKKIAEKAGIKFADSDHYDIDIFEQRQYDIGAAMRSGRNAINNFIAENYGIFKP
ncbi:MAG: NADH:flavin oxidoreductase [Ferroplasma sp.]